MIILFVLDRGFARKVLSIFSPRNGAYLFCKYVYVVRGVKRGEGCADASVRITAENAVRHRIAMEASAHADFALG